MKKRILLPLLLAAALLGLFFFTRYGLPQFYTPEWAARHVFWGSFSGNCSAASKRTFRPNICITVG